MTLGGYQESCTNLDYSIIGLVASVSTAVILSTFPGWHEEEDSEGSEHEVKSFPSRIASYTALVLNTGGALFGLASAFWQHIGGAGASTLTRLSTYDAVVAQVGPVCMALGWLAAALVSISSLGMLLMVVSIHVLNALAD